MPTPEHPRLHPLSPLVDVFIAPTRAMRGIRARPAFTPPLLVAVLVTIAVGFAAAPRALDAIVEQIHSSTDLDAAERENVIRWIEDHESFASGLLAVGGTLTMLLTVLMWSLILHVGITMTFSNRPETYGFVHTLSLTAHANLVNIPQFLLQVVLLLAGSNASLSLAGLLGLDASSPTGTALAWVSPFNFWWLALLGIGVSVLIGLRLGRALWIPVIISLGLRTLQIAFAAFTHTGAPM